MTHTPIAARGFTLVEVMLASALGALLLVAAASGIGMFGSNVHALEEQISTDSDEALAAVVQDVRYAWSAELPSARSLKLTDAFGQVTTYAYDNGALRVTRPDGSTGLLAEELSSVSFAGQTVQRIRENTPLIRKTTWWSSAAPAAVPTAVSLESGQELALGFMAATPSPLPGAPVAGVTEKLAAATLDTLNLVVGSSDAAAGGQLKIDLYRARAPHDSRPEGSSLGSVSVALKGLPTVAYTVLNTKTGKKVKIPAGSAWGWWKKFGTYVLVPGVPAVSKPLDLSKLAAGVKPGYAYTLVLGVSGTGGVTIRRYPVASATNSGVAYHGVGAAYSSQAWSVARSLDGTATGTQAVATNAVRTVTVALTTKAGVSSTVSATLLGQDGAEHPWLGSLPSELPSLLGSK